MTSSAQAAIIIDGKVGGFAEGYSQGFNVTLNIDKGPQGVGGAQLFLDETATSLRVGFIAPLILNDNTYGTTRATDWGSKEHFLRGGGTGLAGSDKWEIKIDNFNGGSDKLEIKLDYIEEFSDGSFDTRIERFKLGMTNLDQSKIDFDSSLDFNHNNLGITATQLAQFFALGSGGAPSNSPTVNGSAPTGTPIDYSFDSPAQNWRAEIAYEFEIQKDAIPGFTLTSETFRNVLFAPTVFHMSPNKLGGNAVTVAEVKPIPEPSSIVVWSLLVIGAAVYLVRRERGASARGRHAAR